MMLSNKLITILLTLNCQLAFAGTGSAEDGYSIMLVLIGILVLIHGTPYLISYTKTMWQFIKRKIHRHFNSINLDTGLSLQLKPVIKKVFDF